MQAFFFFFWDVWSKLTAWTQKASTLHHCIQVWKPVLRAHMDRTPRGRPPNSLPPLKYSDSKRLMCATDVFPIPLVSVHALPFHAREQISSTCFGKAGCLELPCLESHQMSRCVSIYVTVNKLLSWFEPYWTGKQMSFFHLLANIRCWQRVTGVHRDSWLDSPASFGRLINLQKFSRNLCQGLLIWTLKQFGRFFFSFCFLKWT